MTNEDKVEGKWSIEYENMEDFEEPFELIWFAQALASTLQEVLEEIDMIVKKRRRVKHE